MTGSCKVFLTVLDQDDTPPEFDKPEYVVLLRENTEQNTSVSNRHVDRKSVCLVSWRQPSRHSTVTQEPLNILIITGSRCSLGFFACFCIGHMWKGLPATFGWLWSSSGLCSVSSQKVINASFPLSFWSKVKQIKAKQLCGPY